MTYTSYIPYTYINILTLYNIIYIPTIIAIIHIIHITIQIYTITIFLPVQLLHEQLSFFLHYIEETRFFIKT